MTFINPKMIYFRKFNILIIDYIFCLFSIWVSLSIEYNSIQVSVLENIYIYIFPLIVYSIVFFIFSIHKHFVRYTNVESIVKLIKAFALYSLIITFLFFLYYNYLNITLLLNHFTSFFLFCLLLRIFFSIYFNSNKKKF